MIAAMTERNLPFSGDVTAAWEDHAAEWLDWARTPGFDSYWQFHRDQFLTIVPPPGRAMPIPAANR